MSDCLKHLFSKGMCLENASVEKEMRENFWTDFGTFSLSCARVTISGIIEEWFIIYNTHAYVV